MSKYDWSNVPKEAEWIATDSDGSLCGYSVKPQRFSLGWNTHRNGNFVAHSFIPPFKGDWRDSLEERPNDNISRFDSGRDFHIIVCCFSCGMRFG